jgi:sulfur carrier protein
MSTPAIILQRIPRFRKDAKIPFLPHMALSSYDSCMHVRLCQPERDLEIKGPKRVKELLRDLGLVQEAHLVIRGDDLVTEDEMLKDDDKVEIRPVISGGAFAGAGCEVRDARGNRTAHLRDSPEPEGSRLHNV